MDASPVAPAASSVDEGGDMGWVRELKKNLGGFRADFDTLAVQTQSQITAIQAESERRELAAQRAALASEKVAAALSGQISSMMGRLTMMQEGQAGLADGLAA